MPSQNEGTTGISTNVETTSSRETSLDHVNLPAPRAPEAMPAPQITGSRFFGRNVLLGVLALFLTATALFIWRPWATAVPVVAVEAATPTSVARILAINGRVAGIETVDVRPLVSGRITVLPIAEGDAVATGAVLASIDARAQAAIVRQAMAGLDAALVAQGAAAEARARAAALGAGTSRVALAEALRAELTAGQEVQRMTAVLEQAQVALSLYTVTAPLAGTVTDLPVVTGQTIDPGTVLMTIADMGRLVVEAVVDETHALELKTGLTATMRPTGSSEVLTGRVSRVAQVVDAATGGLAVTLTPDTALVAPIGLTVTANITIEDRSEAITVPRAAVIADEAGTAVFVLDGDIAARRAVSVIEWPAARLIVTEGLSPGDPVITDATGLTDGAAVAVAVP
jgi:RND family efflux transporter MFP subunit